jgi:hypothetical protein
VNDKKRRKQMKTEGRKILIMMALVLVLSLSGLQALAQDKPADNLQLVLEKIKADKRLLVAENMQLTDAEAKAFWPVYDQYQNELFLIRVRTGKLINDYVATYETMTNATAQRLLDESMTIETLRQKLNKAFLPKFRKALPGIKAVRYYQIENKINAALYYELAARIPLVKADKK